MKHPPLRASGLTLIELLAALVIISVMLSSIVGIRVTLMQQWVAADQVLGAVDATEHLLATWLAEGFPPTSGGGTLHGELIWRTREQTDARAQALDVRVVRMEVHHRTDKQGKPLIVVDTVWPGGDESEEARQGDAS